jgi:hypothetical protein
MGILDDAQPIINDAELIANNIKGSAKNLFQMMVNNFNHGSKNFWNNPRATPSEIAAALGNDAKEVFELHYALGQLVGNIKPEAISTGLGLIGQFTMNEDGTVTIQDQLPNPSGSV